MYTVYALYSAKLDGIYIGYTNNLIRRYYQHISGMSKYTSRSDDWAVAYCEYYNSKSEAMKAEKSLKSAKGREKVWKVVRDNFSS
ncbi:MAG: GIY-YIG nuclease family protein [Campylobacterota bacterium]|nr:GIY-YIG nuclease family protein [Campylobacterota bacterium]